MGNEYKFYYGCVAICSNRKVLRFEDLYSDHDMNGYVGTFAECADCECPMDIYRSGFKCKKCGQYVSMHAIYDLMGKENEENLKEMFDNDYDEYY